MLGFCSCVEYAEIGGGRGRGLLFPTDTLVIVVVRPGLPVYFWSGSKSFGPEDKVIDVPISMRGSALRM